MFINQKNMILDTMPHSCSSIRKISIVGCQLKIHDNVRWDQLKWLTMEYVSLSELVINKVLSSTPQLEVLILRLLRSFENLNICSNSLKRLPVESYGDGAEHRVLTIWAPNVETLEISGILYRRCVLMNVLSLKKATVCFPEYCEGILLIEDILREVYRIDRHVEKVSLSSWCIEVLRDMKKQDMHMLASLSNTKFLKLYDCEVDYIRDLFEIFPKLTMLVFEDRDPMIDAYENIFEIICDIRDFTKFDVENSLETESRPEFPNPRLLHLRTVEIDWIIGCTGYESLMLPIIDFILKHASKLEKFVLRVTGSRSVRNLESVLLETAAKLLRMPRSSPTAEVILHRE